MAEEHSFEAHRKTQAYIDAKERLLDKMAKWGGLIRRMPGAEENPAKRRAELRQQAAELAKRDFPVVFEEKQDEITDRDLPAEFFQEDEDDETSAVPW